MTSPARRGQLLAAAQEVFVAQGYHAAAMDEIAERAGVSKPVLYKHFPGKLDLYLALLDVQCETLVARVTSAICGEKNHAARITEAIRAYFAFIDHETQAFRLIFESDLRNDMAVRERVEHMEQLCVEAVAESIMVDPGIPPQSARLLAAGLVGAATASARFWVAQGRRIPRATAERLIASLAWSGVASFPLRGEPS